MLNISLPDNVEAVIIQQAEQAGFDTATDYLVHLVLREQERLSQKAKIEAPLIEGLERGRPIEATDQWRGQKQATFLWQQVAPTEIAQRLRERAATYTGSASEGLPDAAFDRETSTAISGKLSVRYKCGAAPSGFVQPAKCSGYGGCSQTT